MIGVPPRRSQRRISTSGAGHASPHAVTFPQIARAPHRRGHGPRQNGRAAALGLARRGVGHGFGRVTSEDERRRATCDRGREGRSGARAGHERFKVCAFGDAARRLTEDSGGIDLAERCRRNSHESAISSDGATPFATNHLGLHALLRHLEPLRPASSSAVRDRRVVIIGSRLETKGAGILSERFENLQAAGCASGGRQ